MVGDAARLSLGTGTGPSWPIICRSRAIAKYFQRQNLLGKAKRTRNIVNKLNLFFRHHGPTPDIVRRPRGKGKQLEVLYQLVPLARIPKRLRFYEDAAKVVQRRIVPNIRKSFEKALRTARR